MLETIFGEYGFLPWLIGVAMTFVVETTIVLLFRNIPQFIHKRVVKRRIEKSDKHFDDNFDVEEIHHVSHAPYCYEPGNLRLSILNEDFYISMPGDIRKKIEAKTEDFEQAERGNLEEDVYFGSKGLDKLYCDLMEITGVQNKSLFIELLIECKDEIANTFLERSSVSFFNGGKYGIKEIRDNRGPNNEEPRVEILTYKTDYYTHRVMALLYQKLIERKLINVPRHLEEINTLSPFLTCIGMNVLLVIENRQSVVLTKRSEILFNMTKDEWHVSMNEGINLKDARADGTIDKDYCVRRGLEEELGIIDSNYDLDIKYGDIMMLKNPLEIGITSFVYIDKMTFEDLKIYYSTAKDSTFESTGDPKTGLEKVHLSKKDVDDFYNRYKDGITPACKYSLNMLLFRGIANKSL